MAAYALPGIFVMGCLVYFMEPYVIRCPGQSEWNIRAEIRCQNIAKYFCLYNYIHYTYEEGCTGPEWDIVGSKRVYSRDFNTKPCNDTRYQPIKFVTNGSSDCIFRKSLCTEEGQTLLANGSTKTDSTCRCDYKQGYAFVTVPRNKCSCRPSEEDCSCYVKKCQGIGYNLSADYECTKDVTKKTVCLLMSENPSEDPHIDMAPTGTPREYDSYAIKRTCDVAILVSICFLVIIVITICALFHQRLPRCPCLFTNQCSSPSGTPEKKKHVDPDQLKLIKGDEGNKILWNEANEFTKEGAQEPEKKPEPMKTPAPPKVPQAVEELNVVDIHGKTSFTGRAQKKAEGQAEWKDKSERINRVNLFVKNLNHNIDDERLRKEFSQFGTITSAKVETKDGRSKGFGYVCFRSPEEATKAITEMNGRIVDGKALYVAFHQRKEDRKAHLASQPSQVDGLAIKEEEQEGAAHTALLDDNASSFKQARAKQEDERMTEATTSRYKSNYFKIVMVVLDVSTRAVRVQFDKDIDPVRLQSILKEGIFNLNNLKTKKHITQPQWNLLFPKAGEQPSSKDFDITLMICLLRNLISIDIMDELPSATDTSVGADLSRIKYYRNIIVHSNSALLDDTYFKSYWNDVTLAILRLGGNSLKVECDDWCGEKVYAKQREKLALVEETLEKIKKSIESDQEKSNPVPNNIRVPIIELKGHTFKVDDGKSVAIECNGFKFDEKRPPFWEWIHEDDKTKKLTIREDKKEKYLLNSDPPYLWIFNAEMSDRGYYHCCIEYSTSNGDKIVRSKKAHLIVEKAVKPGDIHTHIERQDNMNANQIITNNTGMVCFGEYTAEGGTFPINWPATAALRDNTGKRSVLFEETNKKQIESEQEKSNPVPKNIEEREEKERIDMERKINEERKYKETIEKSEKDRDIEIEERERKNDS